MQYNCIAGQYQNSAEPPFPLIVWHSNIIKNDLKFVLKWKKNNGKSITITPLMLKSYSISISYWMCRSKVHVKISYMLHTQRRTLLSVVLNASYECSTGLGSGAFRGKVTASGYCHVVWASPEWYLSVVWQSTLSCFVGVTSLGLASPWGRVGPLGQQQSELANVVILTRS